MSENGQTETAASSAEAPKRGRPPKSTNGTGDFVAQLRALAETHRGRVARLAEAEKSLAERLAKVRQERELAEAPLREVEATLARFPELALEAEQEAAQ